jgi:hypothetical protein
VGADMTEFLREYVHGTRNTTKDSLWWNRAAKKCAAFLEEGLPWIRSVPVAVDYAAAICYGIENGNWACLKHWRLIPHTWKYDVRMVLEDKPHYNLRERDPSELPKGFAATYESIMASVSMKNLILIATVSAGGDVKENIKYVNKLIDDPEYNTHKNGFLWMHLASNDLVKNSSDREYFQSLLGTNRSDAAVEKAIIYGNAHALQNLLRAYFACIEVPRILCYVQSLSDDMIEVLGEFITVWANELDWPHYSAPVVFALLKYIIRKTGYLISLRYFMVDGAAPVNSERMIGWFNAKKWMESVVSNEDPFWEEIGL